VLPVIRVAETGLHDLRYLGCAARDGAIRVEVVRADASEAPEFAQATQDDMRYLTDNGVQVEALASASMACECIHAQR
jgi:hypothetical protein